MRGKQLYLFSHHKDNAGGSSRSMVILPLDILILLSVIAILLFTISFSMGVERGKKVALKSGKTKEELIKSRSRNENTIIIRNENRNAETPSRAADRNEEDKNSYHVQVASFKKENSARKEVEKLESNGYPVVVMKKGNYVVIYVGGFENEKEARSNFKNLKKKYKDCIFKKSL